MASISNAAANLYNHTARVTDPGLLNDKKVNGSSAPATVAQAKLAAESTIVSIGGKQGSEVLTYNAQGRLGDQNARSQDPLLQAQSMVSDTLNTLMTDTSAPSDIVSQLNSGV